MFILINTNYPHAPPYQSIFKNKEATLVCNAFF